MATAPTKAPPKPAAPPAKAAAPVVVKKPATGTSLATYKERLAEVAKKNVDMEASTSTGNFFTLPSGILTYQGQAMPNNEAFVIVLDSIMEHNFYEGAYNPNSPAIPVCFAFGRDADDMRAHEASSDPQGGANHECATCEHNEWGTGKDNAGNPTKGKACQQRRRLMLIPQDALKGGVAGIAKAEVGYFKLSVTSVKIWSAYVKTLFAQYKMPPFGFVTKIKVERDPRTQFQILFSADAEIENVEILQALESKAAAHQKDLVRPYEQREEEAPKPAAATKRKFR